jgi:serine/threonine-protein kinase
MSKRMLVIERDDQGQFVLAVKGGTLTIGASSAEAEIVLRDLHVSRLHCEVEVDEEIVVADTLDHNGAPQQLRPGSTLHAGLTHLQFLLGAPAAAAQSVAAVPAEELPELAPEDTDGEPEQAAVRREPEPSDGRRRFRFLVVDGADKGRHFALPESGIVTVGKSHKHADIILNDLYVSRVHCELEIESDHLVVGHVEGQSGTLVNGQQIVKKEMYIGETLRVGNSHLILESFEDSGPVVETDDDVGAAGSGDEDPGFQVLDQENDIAATETVDEVSEVSSESFVLPHSPVDELLELEDKPFGHFKIETLLGRGQSGMVFRAQDQKSGQTVSLKVLPGDFPASEAELSRFINAVKAASKLHHAALVTVIAAGKSGQFCWISREFVKGENLTRRIRRIQEGAKPDWKADVRLALHLASLLQFLHGHNVTHGNITPRNILIRASDQMTKLADLAFNYALEGSKLRKTILPGKLLSELPFTAPEQCDPRAPVSPLGDIYALGAVLYAALTGKPPFTGENIKGIHTQIQTAKVVPPSKLQRGIPPLLDTTVLTMMARRPEERFQSAGDLLAALESFAEKHEIET